MAHNDCRRLGWRYYADRAAMKHDCEKPYFYRVRYTNWEGPGWYFVETYRQRCPRNCCDDDVIEFTAATVVVKEVAQEMVELATRLRETREKERQGPP